MRSASLPRGFLTAAILWGALELATPEVHALKAYQKELLRLHNQERAKRHRKPLRFHRVLNKSSVSYAKQMSREPGNYLSHTGPDGSTLVDRILKAGGTRFRMMGENIAFGQRSPRRVTKAWMKSTGHRRNILNARFRYVGFGKAGSAPHWVANFAR